MSTNNSISARTQRLNKFIVSCSDESSNVDEKNAVALNREALLDAFDVLFNEYQKDPIRKTDASTYDFTKKCKFIARFLDILGVSSKSFHSAPLIQRLFIFL